MNKDRRKRLEEIQGKLEDIRTTLEDLKCDVECIMEEEQEAYDNLPESLQESERGCNMQENIDDLSYAIDVDFDSPIDELSDYIQNCIDR